MDPKGPSWEEDTSPPIWEALYALSYFPTWFIDNQSWSSLKEWYFLFLNIYFPDSCQHMDVHIIKVEEIPVEHN